jgi:Predicted nucleotide-binding protein containing TIR-like domain
MKPSVFVGSSSEALEFARSVKHELAKHFQADVWDEGIFQLGESTLDEMLRFIQSYDFAVLVLNEDDVTKSRKVTSGSPRDNVIFELGLFMGALGRRRAFSIIRCSGDGSPKIPSDLLGNTSVYLGKDFPEKPTETELEEALKILVKTIQARSEESILQLLPSTGLAIGYFNNFVLPVCQELANRKSLTIGDIEVDISKDNFDFTVVLPKSLSDASVQGAKRFVKSRGIDGFALETSGRPYHFYVSGALEQGRVVFYDYPTTLGASHEAVQIALAGPFLSSGKGRHAILDAKEISNFARTLDILLSKREAAEFRDNVKIIQAL